MGYEVTTMFASLLSWKKNLLFKSRPMSRSYKKEFMLSLYNITSGKEAGGIN